MDESDSSESDRSSFRRFTAPGRGGKVIANRKARQVRGAGAGCVFRGLKDAAKAETPSCGKRNAGYGGACFAAAHSAHILCEK